MTLYNLSFDKAASNTAFRVQRNPFVLVNNERYIDNEFQNLLQNTSQMQISKEDIKQIFTENDELYINTQIATALTKLKDTSGKQVDFNTLNAKQQGFVLSFLTRAFDEYTTYGTMAKLDDIRIEPNKQDFYIQANIYTIDGQVFSSAAKFSPKTAAYVEKYDKEFIAVGDFADFDRDYKISFSKAGILSTNERKTLLNEIESAPTAQLNDFDGDIEIAFYAFSQQADANTQEYSGVSLYKVSNIKLDLVKANEVLKNLAKNEQKDNQTQSFLDMFWDKFKSELYFSMQLFNQKQKLENFSNSQNQTTNNNLFKTLLNSVSNDEKSPTKLSV